ncbi:hypothetical protein MPS_3747 [Mycobacterium pseudoshottsii JCM 15466]|nr:hypothetical protein MPS_3747 [Mycobacterium pseudoshottsii JCM 15466]
MDSTKRSSGWPACRAKSTPMRQTTGRRDCTGNRAYRIMLSTIIFQMAVRTVKQMD